MMAGSEHNGMCRLDKEVPALEAEYQGCLSPRAR